MHTDARYLPDNSEIHADLCIVGAGAAGIAMALDWNGRREKVILLEGGGFEYEPEVQDQYDGTSDGQRYYPLMSTRLHYFGGTTGHWSGLCTPFDAIDFELRPWVPHSGWPIDGNAMHPFYAKAGELLGLESEHFEYDFWKAHLPNPNPFPLHPSIFWNKMWQYSKARFGTLHKEALMQSKNIHLLTYANATEIKLQEDIQNVREIVTKNLTGKTVRIRAKRYVLACGTIQNARLLLASNRQIAPGIGNENDQVGRYFMEHPEVAAGELWLKKPFETDLYFRKSSKTRASAEIAFSAQTQEKYEMLNGTLSFFPLGMGQYQTPRINLWQNKDPRKSKEVTTADWGAARRKAKGLEGAVAYAFKINARLEQAPNPESRVTLAREKDALGVPRTHLHWKLGRLEKHSLRTMCMLLGLEVGKNELGRVRLQEFLTDPNDPLFPDYTNGGWHHMGTTRMHQDPKKGVVDSNCRIHNLNNLFVAGASCFSTGGAANPTLTLTALTLRLSEHLKKLI